MTTVFTTVVGILGLFGAVQAQDYPSKSIRLVVPFPAGGSTDILARALSVKLGEQLKQAMVVDNKPGAGGSIGTDLLAKSPADGYSLMLATSSTHSIGPSLSPKLPYDVEADFTPIITAGNITNVVLVTNNLPVKSVAELIAYAKKNPTELNYASSGNGTIVHLQTELFKSMAGVNMTHIPYKGTALAMPDVMSGKVQVIFDSLTSALPHIKEGKVRALAVTGLTRSTLLPELPTVAETVPGYESVTWFAIYGPKGLPVSVVESLNKSINAVLADKEIQTRFASLGIEPVGGSSEKMRAMVRSDKAKWAKIILDKKITAE